MADPQKNQREDEQWIGKPHPAEPDEIGKAHEPVEFDDEEHEHDVASRTVSDDGAKAPETDEMAKRPKNPTK